MLIIIDTSVTKHNQGFIQVISLPWLAIEIIHQPNGLQLGRRKKVDAEERHVHCGSPILSAILAKFWTFKVKLYYAQYMAVVI